MKDKIFKSISVAILLLFLFSAFICVAQNEAAISKNKTHTFSLGYEKSYFKDLNYSSLNNIGDGLVLQYQLERKLKSNDLFLVALDLPFAITKPKVADNLKAIQTITNIEVAYLKNLAIKNEKFQLYVGGQYHTYYHLVFFDGTSSFTMFGVNGIDASAKLNYNLDEKQNISTRISLPIIAQLVRPPYGGWDKFITDNYTNIPKILTRGKVTSLNKFFGFNFDLNYEYQYKAKRSFVVNYGMRYYTTSQVEKSIVMNNQINFGINFKL